jgi:hypothetical protein
MPNAEFVVIMTAVYVPIFALMLWPVGGKQLRRWWRRRKLNITEQGENVRTISGPLWDISWIKVSEIAEKYPGAQNSTVIGQDLPEAIQVLKARYGDEFDERNVRRATKQSYTDVIVGIPEASK